MAGRVESVDGVEGRRQRKRRQTRTAIAEAAFRLFVEQGYERTTIAQIAAEADVATKTFFNHFPAKEAVLFADADRFGVVVREALAEGEPGERPAAALTRICARTIGDYSIHGLMTDLAAVDVYRRLITTVPAVRAMALQVSFDLQREIAATLHQAYPDDLDPVTAAAAVGAMIGAVQAVAFAVGDEGQLPLEEQTDRARRAMEVAIAGLGAL